MDSHVPHTSRIWLYTLTVLVLFFLVVPTFIVVPMSFSSASSLVFPPPGWSLRWYGSFFQQDKWQMATWVSVRTGFFTMILATILGTAAAYSLHLSRFILKGPIYGLLVAPLLIPVILLAIGLYFAYAATGLLNTISGLVLATTLTAIPFVLVTVTAGFKSYDMSQEMVARSLGASRLRAFFTVTLPQIKLSVISGALLSFILAFDEVVISSFISGGTNSSLTKVMFSSLRNEVDPTIAAISTLLIALSSIPMIVMQFYTGRKKGTHG